jgi:D-tyrosyl-tRNA(Tyr) deacylase
VIALIQRVSKATVSIGNERIAEIGRGILALVAVERGDAEMQAERLAERILGYRIFPDAEDRMNLSVTDIHGELLLVSQFTLAADTRKGARPSFTPAAMPDEGRRLFHYFVTQAKQQYDGRICVGQFGAHMQVSLVNEGPVTFSLRVAPADGKAQVS